MRVLVITSTGPTLDPLDRRGSARRLGLFMQAFAHLGCDISMAQMVTPESLAAFDDPAALDRQQSEYWGCPVSVNLIARSTRTETFRSHYLAGTLAAAEQPHLYAFAGPEQAAAIAKLLDPEPDVVFVFHLAAMCALLRLKLQLKNLVFDLDDIEHAVRLRYSLQRPLWPGKLAYLAHVPALIAAERAATRSSRLTFVCSSLDVARLAQVGASGRIQVVPNAVPVPTDPPPLPSEPVLMFIGAMDHRPNLEAAERLATRIMPLVRARRPEARALIAGQGSEALPSRSLHPPGVCYLGFVPDLENLYARTRVICCPIRNGGGTRVKILEAAAHARPIVSTRIGAEGLDLRDEVELLLRDDDSAIAAACVHLMDDDAAAVQIASAARRRVEELYDAEKIILQVADVLRKNLACTWPSLAGVQSGPSRAAPAQRL